MNRSTPRLLLFVFAGLLAASQPLLAVDLGDADLDSRSRARLMKEKSKLNAEQQNRDLLNRQVDNPSAINDAECGSQNIGNVNTNGRPGTGPREIFVFAPNAINIVSGQGCRN